MSEKGAGGDEGGSEDDSSALRLEVVGTGGGDDPSEGEPERRRFAMRRGVYFTIKFQRVILERRRATYHLSKRTMKRDGRRMNTAETRSLRRRSNVSAAAQTEIEYSPHAAAEND